MIELSQHILDIAENSIRAGAKLVSISVSEDSRNDLLTIIIKDDGCGMEPPEIARALDPFYTTKTVRRVGLGLPLLKKAAEAAGGNLQINSVSGRGTEVSACFQYSHIDRQPLGNMVSTLLTLLMANSDIDFIYNHRHNDRQFSLDTRLLRQEIGDVPMQHPEIIKYIREVIEEGLLDVDTQA